MEKNKTTLKQSVIEKIMNRAIQINANCKEQCRNFEVMISPLRKNSLILRWTTIDISNIDNPVQCFRYECFKTDGTSELCSVHFSNQKEANEFFWSLEPLYHQQFAIDHKLKTHV